MYRDDAQHNEIWKDNEGTVYTPNPFKDEEGDWFTFGRSDAVPEEALSAWFPLTKFLEADGSLAEPPTPETVEVEYMKPLVLLSECGHGALVGHPSEIQWYPYVKVNGTWYEVVGEDVASKASEELVQSYIDRKGFEILWAGLRS